MSNRPFKSARCCSCFKLLSESEHVTVAVLDKYATWDFPVWTNLLLEPAQTERNRASALLCDTCVSTGRLPTHALDGTEESGYSYHNVARLDDAPVLTKKLVARLPDNKPTGGDP